MMLIMSIATLLTATLALDNGLGRTPAMGYNTWNDYRCTGITSKVVMAIADKFEELGLLAYGYEYINLDDCWAGYRDASGRIVAAPQGFPDGMKPVVDYVHSKGLKFGLYTDRGTCTCASRPGSQGYEAIDAQTFADWGVDYLKEDSCCAPDDHGEAILQYSLMRDALNRTGRPIYFSICGWYSWYAPVGWSLGNMWRMSNDNNGWNEVYNSIRSNENLANYASPGGWNDPDMLLGSSPSAAIRATQDQSRTQFSIWSIMAAPLLISSSILNLTAYDFETFTNREVIAIDQDPLGAQGIVIQSNCPEFVSVKENETLPDCQQIWAKPLANGDVAINMVNFGLTPVNMTCDASCFHSIGFQSAYVRDLWQHADLGLFTSYSTLIGADGASVTLRLSAA